MPQGTGRELTAGTYCGKLDQAKTALQPIGESRSLIT